MKTRTALVVALLVALSLSLIPCAADQAQCEARLKELHQALRSYARENGGRLPATLSALYYEAYLDRLDVFACPDSGQQITLRSDIDALTDYQLAAHSLPALAPGEAALRDPDSHRSLMVRVGRFSAYFAQLDRVFQEDLIARSESDL